MNWTGFLSRKAQVFRPGHVPIAGRFALAGGQPYAADTPQTVRSLAILFKLPGGEEWRTGMVNIPVFVVNTPEDFHDFLVVTSPDPQTGKVDSLVAMLLEISESRCGEWIWIVAGKSAWGLPNV